MKEYLGDSFEDIDIHFPEYVATVKEKLNE